MPRIGPWEIGLILLIVLIFFGVGKLPEIGNALGKGIRSFRHAQNSDDDDKAPAKPLESKQTKEKQS
ncbi:MAG: twin-arginine translocase TatA/TatE family subunit [Chloroflexota bacterium]